jgi:PAS domain S-box-containing protein
MTGILLPFRRSIGLRMLALSGACATIVILAFGQLLAARQADALHALGERDARRLMESVIRSLESIMLPGQAALAQGYARALAGVPEVVEFRIMRPDGNEAFRDNRTLASVNARLGAQRFLPRDSEAVVPILPADNLHLRRALAASQPELVSFERRGPGGERLQTFIYAIPQQPACHVCHGTDQRHLGAVRLTVSMAEIDAKASLARRQGWVAAAIALVAALVLIGIALRRYVVRPVLVVTAAMRNVAAGDLTQAVPVPGEDELGQMAQSFNVMVSRIEEVQRGLQQEQDKLTTVIQSSGEGVVVTDATGAIVLVNDAAVRLLGKRRERIVHDGFAKLLDQPVVVEALLQRQSGPAPTPYKVSYRGRALRVIAATVRSKNGRPIGSAALLRDLSPPSADED